MFKAPNHNIDQLYQSELVKRKIEDRELIIVGIFILQYAKKRMFELDDNFSKTFCDADKDEELEKDTNSLYLARSEENLKHVIHSEKWEKWEQRKAMRSRDCTDSLTPNASDKMFPRMCRNIIRGNKGSLKNSDVQIC